MCVCIVCMYCVYVLCVCIVCMYCVYVLCVPIVCACVCLCVCVMSTFNNTTQAADRQRKSCML